MANTSELKLMPDRAETPAPLKLVQIIFNNDTEEIIHNAKWVTAEDGFFRVVLKDSERWFKASNIKFVCVSNDV